MGFGDNNSGFGNGDGFFGGSFGGGNDGKDEPNKNENKGFGFGQPNGKPQSDGGFGFGQLNSNPQSDGGFGFGMGEKKDNIPSSENNQSDGGMPRLFRPDIKKDEKNSQIKTTKIVTFSNVEWKKFDKVLIHPSGAKYNEPHVHVIANRENIEFHGYNVSKMDEGVYYKIGRNDDFEIECDVDTSQIIPHPGGYFYVSFGIVSAMINEKGGSFSLAGKQVAKVGTRFRMKLCLTDSGKYSIYINGRMQGEKLEATTGEIKIVFGFKHDSHNCQKLSHAYVKNIRMCQRQTVESGSFGFF